MAPLLALLLLLSSLTFPPPVAGAAYPRSATGQGFISAIVSQKGLDFAKDLLVDHALRSLVPLRVPDMERSVSIPLVGTVRMAASNITIDSLNVSSSTVEVGEAGIVIASSESRVGLSFAWSYSYSAWLVTISDKGSASVEVEGMEVGLTIGMKNQNGSLELLITECGCYMKDLQITLNGGASWFYQGFTDAFGGQIRSAVENTITRKVTEEASELDSFLQSLPKEITADNNIAMNVTFVNDPLFRSSSVEFDINGLFASSDKVYPIYTGHEYFDLQPYLGRSSKMLWISLDEAVFNSASMVYFQAGLMNWIVDKVPDQSFLNTASWRFLIPQLYRKYPDDDMLLNISLTSYPVVNITIGKIGATIHSDMTVNVVDANETVPVACISMAISVSGAVEVYENNLVGRAELDDFSLSLKWSAVGDFHMSLVQGIIRVFLRTIFVPYINSHLEQGFPLPIVRHFTIQDAYILTSSSRIIISSDVVFTDSYDSIRTAPFYLDHKAGATDSFRPAE